MLSTLTTTLLKRPYVVLFLLSYIIIATRTTNWKWMLKYLMIGYGVAFFSEYLSIHSGFPYGWYFYKYENLKGEWLNHGVPVWDSVSYVFMCFAGLTTARFALRNNPSKILLITTSALLTTLLDVVIDPLAHMGQRWFLGEIYFYPKPGIYFDVPFSNFVGWFLVSLTINAIGTCWLKFDKFARLTPITHCLGLGLYFGIFAFGFAITVYLQEWRLALCDVLWIGLTVLLINSFLNNTIWECFWRRSEKNQTRDSP